MDTAFENMLKLVLSLLFIAAFCYTSICLLIWIFLETERGRKIIIKCISTSLFIFICLCIPVILLLDLLFWLFCKIVSLLFNVFFFGYDHIARLLWKISGKRTD